jgi:hypothetical protein
METMREDIAYARICPYCGSIPLLVDSKEVYGKSYGFLWKCPKCGAYVGCYPHSKRPLGRLANAQLRAAKHEAHNAFDQIWKSKKMKRTEAYFWIGEKLGLPHQFTHIGMFDVEQCEMVRLYSEAFMKGTLK